MWLVSSVWAVSGVAAAASAVHPKCELTPPCPPLLDTQSSCWPLMGTMARHTIAVLLQPGPLLHRAAIGEVDKVVGRVAHLLELSLDLAPGVGRARRLGDVGLELVLFQRLGR